jgi:hypothetical protein
MFQPTWTNIHLSAMRAHRGTHCEGGFHHTDAGHAWRGASDGVPKQNVTPKPAIANRYDTIDVDFQRTVAGAVFFWSLSDARLLRIVNAL